MLSWALCISTINRLDVLTTAVRLALEQTRPPSEVIVVDASDDWQQNAEVIRALVAGHAGVRCCYEKAPMRSLPAQRNCGIALATADILFLIDDDSFLYPDTAEIIMQHYETDTAGRLAAIQTTPVDTSPLAQGLATAAVAGTAVRSHLDAMAAVRARSRLAYRFIMAEILMMGVQQSLVPYDRRSLRRQRRNFEALGLAGLVHAPMIEGYRMTVRRAVALREPFDDGLITYALAEDLDATYRFSRHGFLATATGARVHHYVANVDRIDRYKINVLLMTNNAYFIRQHSKSPVFDFLRFQVFAVRVTMAALLKDLSMRRFSLPRVRGNIRGYLLSYRIFLRQGDGLRPWYRDFQAGLLRTRYAMK